MISRRNSFITKIPRILQTRLDLRYLKLLLFLPVPGQVFRRYDREVKREAPLDSVTNVKSARTLGVSHKNTQELLICSATCFLQHRRMLPRRRLQGLRYLTSGKSALSRA